MKTILAVFIMCVAMLSFGFGLTRSCYLMLSDVEPDLDICDVPAHLLFSEADRECIETSEPTEPPDV